MNMTKVRLIKLCLFFLTITLNTYAQNITSVSTFGGNGIDEIASLAFNHQNQKFIAGSFNQQVIIGDTLTSIGASDIYLAKLNEQNQPLWSKKFGSTNNDYAIDIVFKNDFIYLAGFFWTSITIDTITLNTPNSSSGLFIAKFDTSGNVIWANQMWGDGIKNISTLAIDNNDNVHATGDYQLNIFIDSITNAPQSNDNKMFYLQLNPNGQANLLYIIGGVGLTYAKDLKLDAQDNIYLLGEFDGTINLNSIGNVISAANDRDGFIIKLLKNTPTITNWVAHLSGVGDAFPEAMDLDENGNIYATGYFITSLSIGNVLLQTATNDVNLFLAKFNNNGQFINAKEFGNSANERAFTMDALDNKIVIGGSYTRNTIIDNITLAGDPFIPTGFIAQFDDNLNIEYALPLGELGFNASVNHLIFNEGMISSDHFLQVSGTFQNQFSVGGSNSFPSNGSVDFFTLNVEDINISDSEIDSHGMKAKLFPNPTSDILHIAAPAGEYQVQVINAMGQMIKNQTIQMDNQYTLPVDDLNTGAYYLVLLNEKGQMILPFVAY